MRKPTAKDGEGLVELVNDDTKIGQLLEAIMESDLEAKMAIAIVLRLVKGKPEAINTEEYCKFASICYQVCL